MVELFFNLFLLLFFGYFAYASTVVIAQRKRSQKERKIDYYGNKVEDKNAKRDS